MTLSYWPNWYCTHTHTLSNINTKVQHNYDHVHLNGVCLCVPQKGFDVFNALDLMENKVFLEKLKFGIGDGNLQYYLFNWKCPPMDPDMVRRVCVCVCQQGGVYSWVCCENSERIS